MRVVSNASPLIALGKLGQLGLLLKLYDEVVIPPEVYAEVVVNGLRLGASEAQAVQYLVQQGHIRVTDAAMPASSPAAWTESLDVGEVQAIELARQEGADWVLIDNLHARKAARTLQLPLKGTVGVLLDAFRRGHLSLPEFELLMQSIKAQPSLWISESLCDRALAVAQCEAGQARRPTTGTVSDGAARS